ncbi:MAG: hypothetical protein WBB76_12930 [Gaiellaceae bacterium]
MSARGPHPPELLTVGVELRRVIPVASDDLGRGIRVVSVEIYDRGLVVRWLAVPSPEDLDSVTREPLFALSDDAGTRYDYFSGGSFGHSNAVRGDALYTPAPPGNATTLDLSPRGERIRVGLS